MVYLRGHLIIVGVEYYEFLRGDSDMKLYLTKENAEAGSLIEPIEELKAKEEKPRYEIRKLDPAEKRYEELFHLLHKRLTLIEKRLDDQESWVSMLIGHYVKIRREEMH